MKKVIKSLESLVKEERKKEIGAKCLDYTNASHLTISINKYQRTCIINHRDAVF